MVCTNMIQGGTPIEVFFFFLKQIAEAVKDVTDCSEVYDLEEGELVLSGHPFPSRLAVSITSCRCGT